MFRDECQKSKFKLQYSPPEDFTRSIWQKQPRVLLIWVIYRGILMCYFVAVCPFSIFHYPQEGYVWYKNLLYISVWTFIFEVVTFVTAFAITLEKYLQEKKPEGDPEVNPMEKMPWQYQFLWFFYNMSAGNSIVVTIMYWFFLYRPDEDIDGITFLIAFKLFNSVFLVFDYFVSSIPYRFLHFYIPLTFGFTYVTFSAIYQLSGGTGNQNTPYLYTILDWREPLHAMAFFLMYQVCAVIGHCGMCTVYFIKVWLKKRTED